MKCLWPSSSYGIKMPTIHRIENNICVIYPEGDMVSAAAPATQALIEALAKDSNIHGVIFNLKAVRFIDSSAITSLLSITRLLQNHQKHVALCASDWEIINLLTLGHVDQIIPFYGSEEDAMEPMTM